MAESRVAARIAPLLVLSACTVQQGKIPVVDEVVLPASVSLDADGTYHVDGTISYHDDDDSVARIRVQIASLNASGQYATPGGKSATKTPFSFKIVGDAPKVATEITVQVIDVEGNISDPKTAKVTLK